MPLVIPPLYPRAALADVRAVGDRFRSPSVDGALIRIRPGVYVRDDDWDAATPEDRVAARAVALVQGSSDGVVVSHESAAALHGLPLLRPDPERVHVTLGPERPGAGRGTIRHRGELSAGEIETVHGVRCTSLARTVADVARTASYEQAVVVADAALRRVAELRNQGHDPERSRRLRRAAEQIAERSAHGRARARRVLAFADGRAQLPGESVSRIRLAEIGFRRIRLQVEVAGPRPGSRFFVDFGIEEADAWGEFDGAIKYVDGRMQAGRAADAVLDEEKQREDWIRGTTQRRFARWGWPHVRTARHLGARLAAFGIAAP